MLQEMVAANPRLLAGAGCGPADQVRAGAEGVAAAEASPCGPGDEDRSA